MSATAQPNPERIYILPCCGRSDAGRLTSTATQDLVLEGKGCWLTLDRLRHLQRQLTDDAATPPTIVVDGCARGCAARSVKAAGLRPEFQLVLADLGIEATDLQDNYPETLLLAKDAIVAGATRVTMTFPMLPGCCC